MLTCRQWNVSLPTKSGARYAQRMVDMESIWPQLKPETREWLLAHYRESVPESIIAEFKGLADVVIVGEYWLADPLNATQHFTPEVTNWIEQKAKDK